jgi:hypothetical protein
LRIFHLEVVEAPKRPDSDKNWNRNKVIKHDDSGDDCGDDGDGSGGVKISNALVSSIKTLR